MNTIVDPPVGLGSQCLIPFHTPGPFKDMCHTLFPTGMYSIQPKQIQINDFLSQENSKELSEFWALIQVCGASIIDCYNCTPCTPESLPLCAKYREASWKHCSFLLHIVSLLQKIAYFYFIARICSLSTIINDIISPLQRSGKVVSIPSRTGLCLGRGGCMPGTALPVGPSSTLGAEL